MQSNSDGKASPGSPFKPPAARIWNNMIDAGRAWADGRLNRGAPGATRPRETDIIKLKNTSGELRRKGEILKVQGKAITDLTSESIWLLGVEPTDECYFGILKRPVDMNGVEDTHVSGACMALVNIIDADHTRAEAVDGEFVLQSSDSGPIEILYAPDETGEQECAVRFSGSGGSRPTWGRVISGSCGWYRVELGTLEGSSDASASYSSDNPCDPCDQVTSVSTAECGIEITYPAPKVVGSGVFVTAYDPQSVVIPLLPGTDVIVSKVANRAATGSGSESDAPSPSGSASGSEPEIWGILRGLQTHIVQYKERWNCCEPGPPVLIGRTPIIFVGHECDEIICGECPPSSGS